MKPKTILTNPTETDLTNAVQENRFALFRAMAKVLPDSEIVETEMGIPVYQRIGFRLTNALINRYLWRNY